MDGRRSRKGMSRRRLLCWNWNSSYHWCNIVKVRRWRWESSWWQFKECLVFFCPLSKASHPCLEFWDGINGYGSGGSQWLRRGVLFRSKRIDSAYMDSVRTLYWYLNKLTRYWWEQESMSMAGQCTSAHMDSMRMLRKKGWPDSARPSATRLCKMINKHVMRCKMCNEWDGQVNKKIEQEDYNI